ncbi:hypothetical protein BG004_004473 [Podila humilis]|nr:hypothetical protein BG004_004473 [Podila humilis]
MSFFLPPEVLLLVGEYLSVSDAAFACRVSHAWHTVLAPVVWRQCSDSVRPSLEALRSISLDDVHFSEPTSDKYGRSESSWLSLLEPHLALEEITMQSPAHVSIIHRSPNLRKFSWLAIGYTSQIAKLLFSLVGGGSMARLDSMEVMSISDDVLAFLLQSMHHVCQVAIYQGGIGPLSCKLLSRPQNLEHLESLRIGIANTVPQGFTSLILASCPRLLEIRIGKVSAEEIIAGAAWVCHDLWFFGVAIIVGTTTSGTCLPSRLPPDPDLRATQTRAIFQRLSQLTCLTELFIPENLDSTFQGDRSLDLSLERGLDLLAPLTRLRVVDFAGNQGGLEPTELNWMRRHWKRLEKVAVRNFIAEVSQNWIVTTRIRHSYLQSI